MNAFLSTQGTPWPLRLEAGYLDEPARKQGRPATGYTEDRTVRSIEHMQRDKLCALGLSVAQQDEAISMCRRGYTVRAAALITIAGNARSMIR